MMPDLSWTTILALSGVAFLAGLVDAIAGGGGLLQMPALLAAGLPPHFALGTNKGASVFGAIASFRKFWSAGLIERGWLLALIASGFGGALLGAEAQLHVSNTALKPVVLIMLGGAAILAVTFKAPDNEQNQAPVQLALAKAAALAFVLGAYDGFFGPGVGTFLIIGFAVLFRLSLSRAAGNGKAVNLASNVASVARFSIQGTLLWKVALPMAVGQFAGGTLGARLAVKRGAPLIRGVLLVVVFALILKVAFDLWQRP